MAFVKNDYQQITFNDKTRSLTEREMRCLEKSWAKVFADIVFPAIREDDFAVLYSSAASRPNTPVNIIIGASILKELLLLNEDELLSASMFDIRFQYALHTTSYKEQPLSDRTLSRFRARCLAYEEETGIDLIKNCMLNLASELAQVMDITPAMVRMDSLMIASNIKKLSRLELFYKCVSNMVKRMEKEGDTIPESMKRYCDERDYNRVVYYARSQDLNSRLEPILKDMLLLVGQCAGTYDDTSEYQLLLRLKQEQTKPGPDGTTVLKEKGKKELKPTNLINPSDPDATTRKKNKTIHHGYVGNVAESVGEKGSLVTDYDYQKNIYSDSQFLKDYIASRPEDYEGGQVTVDGAYAGEDNTEAAKSRSIELIPTNMSGRKPSAIFAEFEFAEDKKTLLKCANGIAPYEQTYDKGNERSNARYKRENCEKCPYQEECMPRMMKGYARKEISWKTVQRAKAVRFMETKEFRKRCDFRNGVEALPSLLRRKYGVDKMPVRGLRKSKQLFGFKIGALNVTKLLGYLNSFAKHGMKVETC